MFTKRNFLLSVIFMAIMGLAFTSVSAQATQTSTVYTYDGVAFMTVHGVNLAFQPGDTTSTPQILSSTVPFSVISYADSTSRDGNVALGGATAVCTNTLTGQQCTLEIAGTSAAIWLDVVFSQTGYTEFSYAGNVIGRFLGTVPVFQPGDTTGAMKVLSSNNAFMAVNYANKNDLLAARAMGSVQSTCNTLVGSTCTLNVQGTGSNMWLAIQPITIVPVTATTTPVAAVATPAIAATPNPLLGQGGGANLLPAQAFPPAGQWVFTNNPASTNTRQASWQQQLVGRVTLDPANWLNRAPNADNAAVNFVVARDGMEVPEGDHTYGEQDDTLNVYSGAGMIRSISADFNLPALGVECHQQNGIGCLLLIVNTGGTAVTFEDQMVKNGWSFEGVIFNQVNTGTTVWAVASYNVASMINLGGGVNEESNCGVISGCSGVMVTVVGHSGGTVEWTGRFLYMK